MYCLVSFISASNAKTTILKIQSWWFCCFRIFILCAGSCLQVNHNGGLPPHTLQIGKCLSSLPTTNNAMSAWIQKATSFCPSLWRLFLDIVSRQLRQVGRKEGEAEVKSCFHPHSLHSQSRFLNESFCNCLVSMHLGAKEVIRQAKGQNQIKVLLSISSSWIAAIFKVKSWIHDILRNLWEQGVYKNKPKLELQNSAVVTFNCFSWMPCTAFFRVFPSGA